MTKPVSSLQLLAPLGYLVAGGALASLVVFRLSGPEAPSPDRSAGSPQQATAVAAPRSDTRPSAVPLGAASAPRVARAPQSSDQQQPRPAEIAPGDVLGTVEGATVASLVAQARAARDAATRAETALNETRTELAELKALLMADRDAKVEHDAHTETLAQEAARAAAQPAQAIAPPAEAPPQAVVAPPVETLSDEELAAQLVELQTPPCVKALQAVASEIFIPFRSGQKAPDRTAMASAQRLATGVEFCPDAHVIVTGHTDSTGDPEMNMALSWKRADETITWLSTQGYPTYNFHAMGFGDLRPFAEGDSGPDEPVNRRVQMEVVSGSIYNQVTPTVPPLP